MTIHSRGRGLLLCLALCLIFSLGTARAELTMGIIGDQFGVWGRAGTPEFDRNLKAAYDAMERGVEILNKEGAMDTVLHVGDFTESTQSPEKRAGDFAMAVAALDRLDSKSSPKWFLTPGDHDVNPPKRMTNSPDRSREADFQALYARVNPLVKDRLYYSFDLKGYHFVSLYSHDHLHCDPRWGVTFLARIGQDQMEWLKQDLERADTTKGVIVLVHQPLWYNAASWQPVHELLAQYNAKLVLAGHTHYDQMDMKSDGIQYLVVGATGAFVKKGNARAGGWWHVTRLTLADNGELSWKLLPVGRAAKADFSNRYDMDRIQVINYILGSGARQLGQNKIYLKDGKFTGPDGKGPARLELRAMGNPVDVPIEFEISMGEETAIKLAQAGFEPGIALGNAGDLKCRIRAGANIASSNNSTVKPACAQYSADYSACLAHKMFWSAVVDSIPGPAAADGLKLTLTARYSPRYGEGEMVLTEAVVIPVVALD